MGLLGYSLKEANEMVAQINQEASQNEIAMRQAQEWASRCVAVDHAKGGIVLIDIASIAEVDKAINPQRRRLPSIALVLLPWLAVLWAVLR